VTDHATYADPTRPSEGIRHLLVGGIPVVLHGVMQEDLPGRPLRGTPR